MQDNTNLDAIYAKHLERLATAQAGGDAKKHLPQGKLKVRDRISELLDDSQDWMELSALAGWDLYQHPCPAGGIVTGIGRVENRSCMIIANDPTVKAGTYAPITVKKHIRALTIALENKLPCIVLVDSGGAYLPKQAELFADEQHFGRIFYLQAQLKKHNIPQIAVVMGYCTAGGAYVPGMSDQTIMVAEQSAMFLAGPPLVQAATGEVSSAQDLGGARLHTRISGCADSMAQNEKDAIGQARARMALSHWPEDQTRAAVQDPKGDIRAILSNDPRHPTDADALVSHLVDGGEHLPFKANFGDSLLCTFAQLGGHRVGILANQGILFDQAARKATDFIQLCERRSLPLIFLQNVPGFMVGKQSEAAGIIQHGAALVHALSATDLPKFTVITGSSYGAGNYAMCGRAFSPRFLWSWPQARIGVMGGAQASAVLEQLGAQHEGIAETYEKTSQAIYGSARLWDDGIILPEDTRKTLIQALNFCAICPI